MKTLFRIILVLVAIFIAVTLLGIWGPEVASWWRGHQYSLEVKQAEDVARGIEQAYKNDLDGGKTPEETLELFLSALKLGNTFQASKYYELSVQSKALSSLQSELAKNGNLQKSLDYFTEVKVKGTKKCNKEGDGCVWEYEYKTGTDKNVGVVGGRERIFIPAGSSRVKEIGLSLNEHTFVWKITQPF